MQLILQNSMTFEEQKLLKNSTKFLGFATYQ